MDVVFEDPQLALIETERASETTLPVAVLRVAKSRLNILRAAPDEQTMLGWLSLRYYPQNGVSGVSGFVDLTSGWKLWLRVDVGRVPNQVLIVGVTRNS